MSKFSRNELPKSVCSKFNQVHEATPCAVMVLLYGINSLRVFFQTMIWLLSLSWNHFVWNDPYKLYSFELYDTRSNNFLSVFYPERSLMKCSLATKSSNLMIEVNKVICMDVGVYVFYICLYVYICLYRYVLFTL